MNTPRFHIRTSKQAIIAIDLHLAREQVDQQQGIHHQQLLDYLSGKRKKFSVPLDPAGTQFQKKVWRALKMVPYGSTLTYGALAKKIGVPTAVRAVASAVARNPIAIVIPCHRIVPVHGGYGKYRWGTAVKKWLLNHERVLRSSQRSSQSH